MTVAPHPFAPLSILPGIVWPGLPNPAGQRMLAVQFQFTQSEVWPPEQMRQVQFMQLAQLLQHARSTVPFYRDRLPELRGSAIDPAAFAQIPLLRRQDIQDHYEQLQSRAVPPDHGAPMEAQTSGSTGRPIRFLSTELTRALWQAFTLREHLCHGREFAGKLAAIRGPSRVQPGTIAGWGPATGDLFRTGPGVTYSTEQPMSAQAGWLIQENPEYLISIASNARELARYCRQHGLRPSRLREVRTYGEALHAETRKLVREAWGVPVVDMYSCRESGYLAVQCPRHEHYHVQSEGVLLELLNAQGEACAPGELGRVVITPLHNFAMPLIRYEIGDYAEAGEPCDCGRTLPVIRHIAGRVRNMLQLRGGGLRFPRFGEYEFGSVPAVRQFQVVQKTFDDVEVALVVARPLTAAEEDTLRALILKNLGHSFRLSFSYRDQIPRAASGKFEDFRSEVVV